MTQFIDPDTIDLTALPPLLPYMPEAEYKWLLERMDRFVWVVEIGGGLGSFYWNKNLECTVFKTIEHDPRWFRLLAAINCLAPPEAPGFPRLDPFFGPPEPPFPDILFDRQAIPRRDVIPYESDLCFFLDGSNRFYWASHIAECFKAHILIHDWNRPEYKEILTYYDIVEEDTSGQGCALLKPKPLSGQQLTRPHM